MTELDENEVLARQWSTLDLCGPDSWTIITGHGKSRSRFSPFQEYCDSIGINSRIWRLGEDFDMVRQPWFSKYLNTGGGLLIRPDQHILLEITEATSGDSMVAALQKHLGGHHHIDISNMNSRL